MVFIGIAAIFFGEVLIILSVCRTYRSTTRLQGRVGSSETGALGSATAAVWCTETQISHRYRAHCRSMADSRGRRARKVDEYSQSPGGRADSTVRRTMEIASCGARRTIIQIWNMRIVQCSFYSISRYRSILYFTCTYDKAYNNTHLIRLYH